MIRITLTWKYYWSFWWGGTTNQIEFFEKLVNFDLHKGNFVFRFKEKNNRGRKKKETLPSTCSFSYICTYFRNTSKQKVFFEISEWNMVKRSLNFFWAIILLYIHITNKTKHLFFEAEVIRIFFFCKTRAKFNNIDNINVLHVEFQAALSTPLEPLCSVCNTKALLILNCWSCKRLQDELNLSWSSQWRQSSVYISIDNNVKFDVLEDQHFISIQIRECLFNMIAILYEKWVTLALCRPQQCNSTNVSLIFYKNFM